MIEALPRREREVFETLCRIGTGTTADVRQALPDTLSDSAVRTLLTRLENKGAIVRANSAAGNLYSPATRTETVAASALRRMVDTFFGGSATSAATALLGMSDRLSPEEIAALEQAITEAAKRQS